MAMAVQRLGNVWWLILLKGIATLILGLLLLTDPGATVEVLVTFLGAYWLVTGIFMIVGIFAGEARGQRFLHLIIGIIGILAGLSVLNHPMISAVIVPAAVVIYLGVGALIMGVLGVLQALGGGGWGVGIWGIFNILIGLLLIARPLAGAMGLAVVLGFFGLIGGIVLIVVAFRIRGVAH